MTNDDCPFCGDIPELAPETTLENQHAYARLDAFPVSKGHLLVIPKRHANNWFDLSIQEQRAVMALIEARRKNSRYC